MFTQNKTSDALHLIRCSVGSETYGLNMSWVRSIQRLDRLRRISEKVMSQVGFVGWLAGRESDIPVFSLARRLGRTDLSPGEESSQRIIILPAPVSLVGSGSEATHLWGLLVDQVSQVIAVSSAYFELLPAIVVNPENNYFEGVVKLAEGLLLLLSPEQLHPDTALYTAGVIETPRQLEARLNASGQPEPASEVGPPFLNPGDQVDNQIKRSEPPGPAQPAVNWPDRVRSRPEQPVSNRVITFSTRQVQTDDKPLVYAISISQVSEILTWLPMVAVPAAPDFVLGVVNWRNFVVPVIDLDARLGVGPPVELVPDKQTQLIIAREADPKGLVGFPIRPGARVQRLPDLDQLSTRPPALARELVSRDVDWEETRLLMPDIAGILGSSH